MHNTILLIFMLMLIAVSASAQFYTITKETPVNGKGMAPTIEITGLKADTTTYNDSIPATDNNYKKKENLSLTLLKARKSDDYKSINITATNGEVSHISKGNKETPPYSPAQDRGTTLPELTIPSLLAEIKRNNIKYPKIVLAQAILETGWFKSSVCRNKHNLFGLTNPRTGQYFEFNHWTESVRAYYTKVQYRYKGGNYLLWLDKIGYAESPGYIRAVISVLRQL